MKTGKLISIALLSLAVACSKENVTSNQGGSDANQYMAVDIAMSVGSSTKAPADYRDGSEAESTVNVNNSIFLFYDAYGNYLTSGVISATDGSVDENGNLKLTVNNQSGFVEKESKAVIVLGPTRLRPALVLAVLNYDNCNALKTLSLADVHKKVDNKAISTEAGKFTMTNSIYVDGNNVVNATPIAASSVKETKEEALKSPVQIYVEREVAKVNMKAKEGLKKTADGKICFETPNAEYVLNGVKVSARIVVDGWAANAFNTTSYLVKEVPTSWLVTNPFANWYDEAAKRTFWAQDPNYTGSEEYVFGRTPEGEPGTYKNVKYLSWNDATQNDVDSYNYMYENTTDKASARINGGELANVPTILIAAHVETAKTGAAWERQDIYKFGGLFYTDASLRNYAAEQILKGKLHWEYTTVEGLKKASVLPDQIDSKFVANVADNSGSVKVEVAAVTAPAEGAKLMKEDNSVIESADWAKTVEDILNGENGFNIAKKELVCFKNGMCYYQVPIKHNQTAEDVAYGTVRNHIYELTLSKIAKIGNPVFNPEEKLVLIPGEEKDYYVSAELKILKWRVITQDVVIE
jgi:hypothetical protein